MEPQRACYSRHEFSISLCTFRLGLNAGESVSKWLPMALGEIMRLNAEVPGEATAQEVTSKTPGLAQPDLPPKVQVEPPGAMSPQGGLDPGEDVGSSRNDQRSTLGREGTVWARPGSTRPPCSQRVSSARWGGGLRTNPSYPRGN